MMNPEQILNNTQFDKYDKREAFWGNLQLVMTLPSSRNYTPNFTDQRMDMDIF